MADNNNDKHLPKATEEKQDDILIESQQIQAPKVVRDFFESVLANNSAYLMAALLSAVLMILFWGYLFGDSLYLFKDIGSDTINYYYPQMLNVSNYLREEGIPAWSFNQGMGQNMLPLSIGDPFMCILYLFDPKSLAYGIAWMEVLKFFIAGFLFYKYLRILSFTHHSSLVGGLAYAFCGFMMVGSGWYVFSTQGVYIAALLLGFERLFQKKSCWLFTIAVFYLACDISFYLYLGALFILVYSTFRLIDEYGWQPKKFLFNYFQMAVWGALGVLMSSVLLFSTIDQMMNSPRVAGDSANFEKLLSRFPFAFEDVKHNFTVIARLFSNDLLGNADVNADTRVLNFTGWYNYLEAPALYSGLFTLLLIPQAISLSSGKKRRLYLAGLIMVTIPVIFPFFRNAIWLFTMDYYRIYGLFFILAYLLVGLSALDLIYKERKINIRLLIITFIFLFLLLLIPFEFFRPLDMNVNMGLRNILLIFLAAQTLVIAGLGYMNYRQLARIAFLGLVAVELILVSSFNSSTNRTVLSKQEFKQKLYYNDYTIDAVEMLKKKDPGFYRISKYYVSGVHSQLNDSRAQDYYSTSNYHSFNHKSYIHFLASLDIINPKDETQTRWVYGLNERPLLQILAHNKYILIKQPELSQIGYEVFDSVGDVKIFKNKYFLPFGYAYDKMLDSATFHKLSKEEGSLKKQVCLLKSIVLDNADMASFAGLEKFETSVLTQAALNDELPSDIAARKQYVMEMTKFSQNNIQGRIKLDKAMAVFFAMPFDPSWSVKVNGKAATLYRGNLGMTALPLPAGEHNIELSFTRPYWRLSLFLSGIGFSVFVVALAWSIIIKRKKNKKIFEENLSESSE